jgi:DNA-binding response OmpR family regulator
VSGAPHGRLPLILVADDDADILELVRFDLEAEGYAVLTAREGDEALRLALDRRPDLAILDVLMPGVGGFDVTRRIRANEAMNRTVVILLTARAGIADILEGFRAGADDYVTKPFEPDELRTRVRALLGLRDVLARRV